MGISELLVTLKQIKTEKHISAFKGQKIAVDIYVWIYKSFYSYARLKFTGSFEEDKAKIDNDQSYLYYLKNRLNLLLENQITPLIVFDSARPKIKAETIGSKRAKSKTVKFEGNMKKYTSKLISTIEINKEKIDAIIQLLEKMNIQYIFAPKEADAQLAYLSKMHIVDAIITEDSDQLVYVTLQIIFFNLLGLK